MDDKDNGLADLVRQELNLPSLNGNFTDTSQTFEGGNSSCTTANVSISF